MKKALVIGIDKYSFGELACSVNDARSIAELLNRNADNSKNFDVNLVIDFEATKTNILEQIKELFLDETAETVLLYFSGHGIDGDLDGSIVTIDATSTEPGVRMTDILHFVSESKAKNKIIILDCCHSGRFGNPGLIGDSSLLPAGTVILTASTRNQVAFEVNGHGVFTNLLIEALNGGASDILGRVTPGNIYSYIDQALSSWEQRPLFKTNVSRFVILRQNKEKIKGDIIRKITNIFPYREYIYSLNPSFESTNFYGSKDRNIEPYVDKEKKAIFDILQQYNRQGLVVPIDANHMYNAAMESKSCKLTPLGQHYWNLVDKNLI